MNQTAQGLAALGRGPDTMLVHMAPQEVAGLQALAMKNGGSLTINPETGLPEAGFLSSILPMVAGFALGPAGFGLMSSAMAGMTVGGISALTSGSLSKGLMAGLGAYGGAGLGESLMGAGTGSLSSAAGAGVTAPPIGAIVPEAALPAVVPESLASVVPASSAVAPAGMQPLAGVSGKFVTPALPQSAVVPPINAAQIAPTITQAPVAASVYAPAESMGAALARDQAAAQAVGSKLATTTPMDTLGAGLKAITASPSAALNFAKANAYPLGALGISALSGMNNEADAPAQNQGMIRPYTYSREKVPSAFIDVAGEPLSSKERRYFTDQYTALAPYKAPGPEYMAVGGPVEDMSNGNNMAAYMGQDKFADGGEIGGYTYDPVTQMYTKKAGEGATMVSPVGGISGASGSSGSSDYVDPNPGWSNMTDREKASYYAENPTMAAITQAGQKAFGLTSLGMLQNYFSPETVNTAVLNAQGFDRGGGFLAEPSGLLGPLGQTSYQSGVGNPAEGGGGSGGQSISSDGQGGYGGTPGSNGPGDGTSSDYAQGGLSALAQGGISNLGDYSDGGRLLRGPGDGVSDDIPAMIGQKQQARLADGEFVVPARIVSELGNGSTEAGARQLYAMMDRVQKARKKTVGKDKVATNSRAAKLLPA